MSDDLRTRMHHVADEVTPLPVSDDLWRRGQSARHRGQALVVAAVLVVLASVGGGVALWSAPDREARTASGEVPAGGAIPSRIEDPTSQRTVSDLAVGRASVAFVSRNSGLPVVIGALDGRYHLLDLPDAPEEEGLLALSPDGRQLAWSSHGRLHAVDLEDGTAAYFGSDAEHADVTALWWTPNSQQLIWSGSDSEGKASGGVLPAGGGAAGPLDPSALRGIPSPDGELVAVTTRTTVEAAPFLRRRGKPVERALPADLYPVGASIRPLGWAADHLVVAQAYATSGSYVEGHHLVIMTSPDRPDSEWTYRIVSRKIPQDAVELSLAVDLLPDLDGTSSQQLTHDFGDTTDNPPAPLGVELSLFIGLAVAAAIAVLMALRWLWRRLA